MSPEAPRFCPRPPGPPGTIAGDLARGTEALRELFPGPAGTRLPAAPAGTPSDPFDAGRARLSVEDLHPPDSAAASKLERILGGDGFLVSTGQQPVLFLGPLYVLYKAATAVEAARLLEERLEVPVLPLFWIASDDHDWPEVGGTRLLDLDNRLREIRLEPPAGRERAAVGRTPVPEEIGDRMYDLRESLPPSEFVDTHLESIRDAYRPGRPLGRAFGQLLGDVLAEAGLLRVDSGHPALRDRAGALYRRVVRRSEEVRRALAEGRERVEEAGYEPQLRLRDGGVPLFRDTESGRARVLEAETGFRYGREGTPIPEEELLEAIDGEPDRFTPSAALRPVLESWLLPVRVAVLGPGETGYWAQLSPLFAWSEVPFPAVLSRRSWSVVEAKVGKVLRKLDAEPEDFRDRGRSLARRVADSGRPAEVTESLERARAAVGRAVADLESAVGDHLPGIRSAVGATRHDLFSVLSELEEAVDERVREHEEVLLDQIRKAAAHLYPGGDLQERVLNPFYYLARYGDSFVAALREETRSALAAEEGRDGSTTPSR